MRTLLVCAILGTLVCVSASAAIPDRERAALLAIYVATDGPNWSYNGGWNGAAGTECDWYGVTCDDPQTTVTSLDVSFTGLKGPIPPSISDLANLEYLAFAGDELNGAIPPELARLSKLKELHLSFNLLTGSIPPALASLTNLTDLELDGNLLTGAIRRSSAASRSSTSWRSAETSFRVRSRPSYRS